MVNIHDMTDGWYPEFPRPYEKSIVLGGGKVLFPIETPEIHAKVLEEYLGDVVFRAFRAGKKAGKAEIRAALFDD